MRRSGILLLVGVLATLPAGCARKNADRSSKVGAGPGAAGRPSANGTGNRNGGERRTRRPPMPPLPAGDVFVYGDDPKAAPPVRMSERDAHAAGLLVVDLGDSWAPFIFQDGGATAADPPKSNSYRQTFVNLANDRIGAEGNALDAANHNFLEPFGIPPTLSVVRSRVVLDNTAARSACDAQVDADGLRLFSGNVSYVDREHARRTHADGLRDVQWMNDEIEAREKAAASVADGGRAASPGGRGGATAGGVGGAATVVRATWKAGDRAAAVAALRADTAPNIRARVERAVRGRDQDRAVRAAQARLVCDGLLTERSRFTWGMFDLATHEALADWERKNDIFGWAALGGETLSALSTPALELDFQTFRRVLAERVADSAGIVEDGSAAASADDPPHGARNLIEEHVVALLARLGVADSADMVEFLAQHAPDGLATLRVAIPSPPLPSYYAPTMELSVQIDRGDVWYDFPFDSRGRLVEQRREHFPHATLFVTWQGQLIPLVSWRTTIGSWRSELHANGKIYYRYKNSDVGPRFWKNIVAGPVWVPPEATPAKDLLTRKVLDREKGAEVVVNTDVMGPGFQSAYGLVMAIHIDRRGVDNQIRTHGSVDYTSIARRFSHGCHRLVNNRAVRLFDFVLRHRSFRRVGGVPLSLERTLVVGDKTYAFNLNTRGYYYELRKPIPVDVTEGRIMGKVMSPVTAYVPKLGVDYAGVPDPSSADAATSLRKIPGGPTMLPATGPDIDPAGEDDDAAPPSPLPLPLPLPLLPPPPSSTPPPSTQSLPTPPPTRVEPP